MLTRRSLLKLLGIGSAAAVVAPSLLEAPVEAIEPCMPIPCPPVDDVVIEAIYSVGPVRTNEFAFFAEQFEGMCAPISPYYTLGTLSDRRPVFNSLPVFNAPRGGVVVLRSSPE